MRPNDLRAHLDRVGVVAADADVRRVLAHIIGRGRPGWDDIKPVARAVRIAVDETTVRTRLRVVDRATDDADGFVKYLLEAPDGAVFEAVRIPLHKTGRYSVCLSSQVGCAMRCAFCATGRLGLSRNLTAAEMVQSLVAVRDELPVGARMNGAVFMGQGEPLHNYDNVIQAARVLSDPCGAGIDGRNISISTVGLVPQMHRFAREGHKFRLIVSLTSAVGDKRKRLLPVAGAQSLADVADAIRAVQHASGDRMTIAWVLLGGINTGADEIAALLELLQGVPIKLNLIDVNDARDDGFVRASDEERHAFVDALQVLQAPIVRRYSGGRNRHAACGMLAAVHSTDDSPSTL